MGLVAILATALQVSPVKAGGRPPLPGVKDLPARAAMPDPLVANDGSKITTVEQWKKRREEMKEILEEYEFGHAPPPPGNVKGREIGGKSLLQSPILYRVVQLKFGPQERLGFNIGILSPTRYTRTTRTNTAIPVILHLTFSPVPLPADGMNNVGTNLTPGGWLQGTPEMLARQYAEPLRRDYAVVVINYRDLGADSTNYRSTAFFPAYPGYDWNDIAAWAWGLSRCVDYLQDQPFADKTKLIAVGHSRVGQAVLLAGAFDERISLVAPAGAGCAFRFAGKGRGGKQGVDEIVDQNTYWFGPRFAEFRGQTDKLPFDQHWLLALAAPRPYILCNATEDQYVQGNAVAQTYLAAKPVYSLLGVPDNLGINFRPGNHALAATDWQAILDYADQQLRGKKADRRFDELPPAEKLH